MERKVQEVKGSLLVTVPTDLAVKHGLRKGAKVGFGEISEGILMQTRIQAPEQTVYTIGYAGRTLDGFLQALRDHGVEQVADVRELPLSRKKGFSKTSMSEALKEEGIEYKHLKPLGAPKPMRDAYKGGKPFGWFEEPYERHLSDQTLQYDALVGASFRKPTALLCVEEDPEECHRNILGGHLAVDGFTVQHIH